jgi:hypothetical protein
VHNREVSRLPVSAEMEHFNFEKVGLLCKDLLANPCREMLAGELYSPSSKHFKRKIL